jgi:hypothetical protein
MSDQENNEYLLFNYELLDRLYCIKNMYDNFILDHENDEDILSNGRKRL